ncbi:MAG: imelysin family protein [Ferruginibacter sp.]
MKKILLPALLAATLFTACKKDHDDSNANFNATKDAAISDFVNKVALAGYAELKVKANTLNTAVITLNTTTTDANLDAARTAWRDLRTTWERSEGFIFGPVEDNEYDPDTDTWPVDFVSLDALLADMSHDLSVADIHALSNRALKGYHPLEYVLWGEGGTRTAASLTDRQKTYMVSLAALLKQTADNLYNDWDAAGGNYANDFLTAGASGNVVYPTKQAAFNDIVGGLIGICGEVGGGKMLEPFDIWPNDPVLAVNSVESPFSGNSVTDFKNNIIGAYNVYLGKFNTDGVGLEDLVKAKNSALDIEIQEKFNAAIQSFDAITLPYEGAINSQRIQCKSTMDAITALATTLEEKLQPFVVTYITD